MKKPTKKLILLSSLVFIWGAFLFYFGGVMYGSLIPKQQHFDSGNTSQNIIAISYDPMVFIGPEQREKCGDFYCYSPDEFVELYDRFELKTQLPISSENIYDDTNVDEYLRKIAEALGYRKRVFADEDVMVSFENIMTRPEVRDAYKKMRDEMKKEGIRLHFISGYRDSYLQNSIFKRKANITGIENIPAGLYDAEIYETLERSALPGYSKHHSGYAADFGCGNDYLVYTFQETECYEWMSRNNFENSKRFGFIPSYPNGVENQGPNPEPWEFVWIGKENLI